MFFIYGWGHKTAKFMHDVIFIKCGTCNKKTAFTLLREREWFTLFFIPIIPYNTEYTLICNNCQYRDRLSGENIAKLKKINKHTQLLLKHEISEDEYKCKLDEMDIHTEEVSQSNEWECPKCKHNNANITYTCRSCGYTVI